MNTARPIITPPPWAKGKPRSMGGAFDILYCQRAPTAAAPPKPKTGPKRDQSRRAQMLAALRDNKASPFCSPVGSARDAERNRGMRSAAI